jgi:trimeric autotransporter adhesin
MKKTFCLVLVITAILAAGLAYKTGVATAENNNDEIQTVEDRSTATIPEKQITMLTPGTCDTAGPIEVESTGGTSLASYARLQLAFNAINNGIHTGTITIDVCGNTTETGTASLNASGSGSANYTSITIRPVGARTISGSIAGAALIQLNGADNVTINGLNSNGNSLTISNTSTSNTAGTSTIRLVNDATNNTITNCSILGSSRTAPTTNGGTIFISTAASSGNDNNTFSNNKIGPAGTNLPTKAVYAAGSTGTTAAYNNNITFSNNEIFDYFSNSTSSFGVYLANGNDNWTFSNNKFYQTAARTQTTGALFHAAINVAGNAGNTSHTFNGNIIGFANASGTGTYSITLGNAGRFAGISISSAGAGGNYNIQNNTITNISVGGSGYGQNTIAAFAAILMAAGGTATISNNIIGSTTTSGALSYSTNSTSPSDVYGIYLSPPANVTISNNTVAGITATNTSTGAILIYGIRAFTNFVSTNTIQNNTVGSQSALIQNNATSSANSRVIGIASQSGASVVTGNTVRNLTMSAPNTNTGILASVIGILSDNAQATTNTISQNTIHSLSNTNSTANVGVVGLAYNGNTAGGPYTVARNFIHSLSVSTISTGYLRGIFHNAGRYVTYQNNMIRLGIDAAGNSVTGAYNIAGYEETVGSSNNFYHNTIYIGGNAGTSNQFSYAFLSSATPLTRNFINNAFINDRSISGGTGANVAAAYAGTLPNPAGLNSNYNFYFSQNPNTIIRNGSTNHSLSSWRTASGNQDGNSFQALNVAQFNLANPTGNSSTVDLHIANTGSSILEQSGTLISSVTDDFDGQNRATFTPVDAGADAANSTQFNTIPPVITYTPLKNTTSTSDRSLNVTITDPDGVASNPLAPRIYYRKGTGGSYVSTECSGTQPNYTCTIDYSLLVGGVNAGDIIQYFVVAQDTLGNLSANPANGFGGTNVNNITSPPTNPNQYRIAQGFSGTVNVGSGQSITSLTNPGGLFDQLNNNVLTGNLVVNITSDLTNESGQIGLNQLTEEGAGAGNYTITIKPSGAPRTISSTTTASRLIWLNGADRVTIDGSLSGGTDRSLTLSLNSSSANTIVVWVASLGPGEGANNITIKNCIIQNGTNFYSLGTVNYGIYVGRTDLNAFGPDNDNLTIQNNLIQRTSVGIQAAGDTTGLNNNTIIADNIIGGTASADFIGRNGITIAWSTGATITRNTVRNIANSAAVNLLGIFASRGTVNSSITGNSVSNMDASYTNATNTLGNGSTGIFVETSLTSSNVTVANNFIYDIRGTGGTTGRLTQNQRRHPHLRNRNRGS